MPCPFTPSPNRFRPAPGASTSGLPFDINYFLSNNGAKPRDGDADAPSAVSALYTKQYHIVLDRQRQAFDAERDLWNTEREALHKRISEKDSSLKLYQKEVLYLYSQLKDQSASSPQKGLYSSATTKPTSLLCTSGSNEEKFWKASNPDIKPTRTFSDASNIKLNRLDGLLACMELKGKGEKRVSVNLNTETIPKPLTSGAEIDKNLDGITFKTSGLASGAVKNVVSTVAGPSSPLSTPSRPPPGSLELPKPRHLSLDDLGKKNAYKMDAGHTPLVRLTEPSLLDGTISDPTSRVQTPEIEPPPRRPIERHDSYFPATGPIDRIGDPDPELKGPLTLTHEPTEDRYFLSEVNNKLLQANEAAAEPSPSENTKSEASQAEKNAEEEKKEEIFEQHEPKLRFKQSMNFGSQFGSARVRRLT